jgi:riboflavin kinase/FMN adenylyltransferase
MIAYPTDRALLDLTPEQFFQRIIREELQARGLVEGPNFFFGHDRAGNVDTLRTLCDTAGLSLEIVPQVTVGGRTVSSSVIRGSISAGKIAEAVELLGHPYRVRGRVAGGAVRGRTLGFPTANLESVATLLPCDGVYAGVAHYGGHAYPAAIHLGPNSTFGEQERKLEIHLVDFSGDLYGEELNVDILDRLRDTRPFANADELCKQVEQDIARTRTLARRQAAKIEDRG